VQVTAVLMHELINTHEDIPMVTEYMPLTKFAYLYRRWRRNCNRKKKLFEEYHTRLKQLALEQVLSIAEFETLLDDLVKTFVLVPDNSILGHIENECQAAEKRVAEEDHTTHVRGAEEKLQALKTAKHKKELQACACADLVLDAKYDRLQRAGVRERIVFQTLMKEDLSQLLYCNAAQIQIVGLFPAPEPPMTVAELVIMPVEKSKSVAVKAEDAIDVEESDRPTHQPHLLMSELVYKMSLLAKEKKGNKPGVALPSAKTRVVSVVVKSYDQESRITEAQSNPYGLMNSPRSPLTVQRRLNKADVMQLENGPSRLAIEDIPREPSEAPESPLPRSHHSLAPSWESVESSQQRGRGNGGHEDRSEPSIASYSSASNQDLPVAAAARPEVAVISHSASPSNVYDSGSYNHSASPVLEEITPSSDASSQSDWNHDPRRHLSHVSAAKETKLRRRNRVPDQLSMSTKAINSTSNPQTSIPFSTTLPCHERRYYQGHELLTSTRKLLPDPEHNSSSLATDQ